MEKRKALDINTHKRSLVKAVIYRGGGVTVLAGITWITTHDVLQVSVVTVVYHVISVVGYYIYERVWEHIKWGKGKSRR